MLVPGSLENRACPTHVYWDLLCLPEGLEGSRERGNALVHQQSSAFFNSTLPADY